MPDETKVKGYLIQSSTIALTRGAFSHPYAMFIGWELELQRNPTSTTRSFFFNTPTNKLFIGAAPIFWRNGREFFRGFGWETGRGSLDTAIRLGVADCAFNGLMDGTGITQITKDQGFIKSISGFFQNQSARQTLSRNIQVAGAHSVLYWYLFIESGKFYDASFRLNNSRTNYLFKCLFVGSVTTIGVIPLNQFKNLYMAGQFGKVSLASASALHCRNLATTFSTKGLLAGTKHSFRGAVPYGIANYLTFGTVEAGRYFRNFLLKTQSSQDKSVGG